MKTVKHSQNPSMVILALVSLVIIDFYGREVAAEISSPSSGETGVKAEV